MNRRLLLAFASLVVVYLIVLSVLPVHASTITVNNTNDGGAGSLRQAVADAPPGSIIDFNVTYPATITLSSGEIVISKTLTIQGPGAGNLVISGNNASRVFNVTSGTAATIRGVTIAGGNASAGGGIYSYGTLTLVACSISDNHASGDGGGVYNHGTLVADSCAFSGNSASYGGGIKNESAKATLTNDTFSANTAGARGGGMDNGGIGTGSTVNVTNSTFLRNSPQAIGNPHSTTTAVNVMVADSTGSNCSGTFAASSTANLATDANCSPGFTQVTLGQLALGLLTGSPAYVPLNAGSVAIDAGTNTGCTPTDQRGFKRPADGNGDGVAVCDVGAIEFYSVTLTLPLIVH